MHVITFRLLFQVFVPEKKIIVPFHFVKPKNGKVQMAIGLKILAIISIFSTAHSFV